mmetsp:Transcript_11836/g.25546  ORF Transcript_11836/g.25546 Transcript_11836/m.25546 type:complete len:217 (-) Transcript_11836:89-739(-)
MEKLSLPEFLEQVLFLERPWRAGVQVVQHPTLEQLLVRDSNLHWMIGWAMLSEPCANDGNILHTPHVARAQIEWPGCPVQGDSIGSVVSEQRGVFQQRLDRIGQSKFSDICLIIFITNLRGAGGVSVRRQRIDDGVVIERREIGIISFDVRRGRCVVRSYSDSSWPRIVHEGERDAVFRADLIANNNLANVIEFVPVIIIGVDVAVQRFKLWAARN